jgi:hypothetical protein
VALAGSGSAVRSTVSVVDVVGELHAPSHETAASSTAAGKVLCVMNVLL